MNVLFDDRFRDLLGVMMQRVRRLRGRREDEQRARHRVRAPSGTFAGHRPYSDGDDLRNVDWNAYARSGDILIKQLEEDERRLLTILLDTSPSMTAGEPPRFDGARRLAGVFGALALARLDGVRIVTGSGSFASFQGATGLLPLLDHLTQLEPEPSLPGQLIDPVLEGGWLGSLLWVADFAQPEDFRPALRMLRSRRRRCTGVLPCIPDDDLPPVEGWIELEDPETGARERVRVDSRLRAAMERELCGLHQQQQALFRRHGWQFVRFPIPDAADRSLASWFPGTWIGRV